MNNYRSAYEEYYKNINNKVKGKKDNNKYLPVGKIHDSTIKSPYGINKQGELNFKQLCIKRMIRELIGAVILLMFFVGLKYIPIDQAKQFHITCKEALNTQFNYDQSIDAFNNIEIGNFKTKDLRIGNLTSEDLKINNLKIKASNFIQYLKNNSNLQVKSENE